MKLVYDKIKNYEKCDKECYNFIKYYFEHNISDEILKFFLDENNKKNMENYIKMELLCYFLCYNICLGDKFKVTEIILKSIFDILFNNFMLFLYLIVSQNENKDDNIIIVLNKIIKDNLNEDLLPYDVKNFNEKKFNDIIMINRKSILDYYKIIINNIYNNFNKNNNNENIIMFNEFLNNNKDDINNINEKKLNVIKNEFFIETYKIINDIEIKLFKKFFYNYLCYEETKRNENNINNVNNIFIKSKNYLLPEIKDKKYTLILDLDDTLIHSKRNFNFRINIYNINKKRSIIFRPHLFEFLDLMKPLYELILFSSSTPDYVDPIVKLIEKEKKYFDYVLYRHHITLDEDGNNVKNLEKIGRDLNKVIIIDDIARYFKLQKKNGINIKPFCGNIAKENKTLKVLGEVLVKIRNDVEECNDIRISLNKFKKLLYPDVIENLDDIEEV